MKHPLFSRTLWLNALAVILIAIESLSGTNLIDPQIQVVILAILNGWMRALTTKGLKVQPRE